MNSHSEQKSSLRKEILRTRESMDDDERVRASRAIVRNLQQLPEMSNAVVVHTYLPAPSLFEVDIMPLVEGLAQSGVKLVVPVVRAFTRRFRASRLLHCRFRPGSELRTNRWGIPEPVDRTPVDPAEIDLVIVPCLACDGHGYRLGFGYGYYDEFLRDIEAATVCPCFEAFLLPEIPREEHDRPVNIIVTELSVLRPDDARSR